MYKIIFNIFWLLVFTPAAGMLHAQTLEEMEKRLVTEYNRARISAAEAGGYTVQSSDTLDAIANIFKMDLQRMLIQGEARNYAFDSLKRHVSIAVAPDGNLRIFSWEQPWNMDWHDMTAVAQFLTPQGSTAVETLSADSSDDPFSNIRYRKIWTVDINQQKCYLALGNGMHGNGSHYVTAELFKIENDALIKITGKFMQNGELSDRLVVEVPTIIDTELEYNIATHEITCTESVFNEVEQRQEEKKKVRWVLENGVFKMRL